MVLADGGAIEHCVERGHFVDAHGRHFQNVGYLVHHGQAGPAAVLLLGHVQQRNDGGLFVLRRIFFEDVAYFLLVFRSKLKLDIIQWAFTMLSPNISTSFTMKLALLNDLLHLGNNNCGNFINSTVCRGLLPELPGSYLSGA